MVSTLPARPATIQPASQSANQSIKQSEIFLITFLAEDLFLIPFGRVLDVVVVVVAVVVFVAIATAAVVVVAVVVGIALGYYLRVCSRILL